MARLSLILQPIVLRDKTLAGKPGRGTDARQAIKGVDGFVVGAHAGGLLLLVPASLSPGGQLRTGAVLSTVRPRVQPGSSMLHAGASVHADNYHLSTDRARRRLAVE